MKLIESCLLEPEIIRLVPVNDGDYSKGDWKKGAEASLIVHQEDVFLSQDNLLIPVDIVDHEEKVKSMIAQRNTFWVITLLTPTDIYLQKCTVATRVPNNFQVIEIDVDNATRLKNIHRSG